MDIPHIYRTVDLFLGLLMIITGIPLFGRELLRFRKQPLRTWGDKARYLLMGLWFVTSGPYHVSRAFDAPHQEASLTGELLWVALAGMGAGLTIYFVARRFRKSLPEQTVTAEK